MRTFSHNGEPLRHYTDGFCGWAIVSEAGRIRYEIEEKKRNILETKEGENGSIQDMQKRRL